MLLRKLLGYRQHPAIIALHSWSPFFNHPNFFSTAEDPIQSIVAYYGLQSVSMRNALFHPTWQRQQNYKGFQWLCDNIHPNTLGHRSAPLTPQNIAQCVLCTVLSLGCCLRRLIKYLSNATAIPSPSPHTLSIAHRAAEWGRGEKKHTGIAVCGMPVCFFLSSFNSTIIPSIKPASKSSMHQQKDVHCCRMSSALVQQKDCHQSEFIA